MVWLLGYLVVGYLVGSIPFGFLVARAVRGIDIRQHGSGNIGATNVGRVLGGYWFFPVFFLDFAKGAMIVALVVFDLVHFPTSVFSQTDAAALAGLAVMIGHAWPVYLGFRGGKGVATGAGVMTPLAFWPLLGGLGVWAIVLAQTRYMSLASVLGGWALACTQWAICPAPFGADHRAATWLCLIGAVLVTVRHRGNLVRVLNGTEPKVGRGKPAKPADPTPMLNGAISPTAADKHSE